MLCVQVLLMVDASYGFEMETFEFLNICQVHGMPKIMGVLSHLDVIKKKEKVKQTKKLLKHRFWTEVYQVSAGLFYFCQHCLVSWCLLVSAGTDNNFLHKRFCWCCSILSDFYCIKLFDELFSKTLFLFVEV